MEYLMYGDFMVKNSSAQLLKQIMRLYLQNQKTLHHLLELQFLQCLRGYLVIKEKKLGIHTQLIG